MHTSLQITKPNKNGLINIMNDQHFLESREVLQGKARTLRELGMGRNKHCKALTPNEEVELWARGHLGDNTPRSVVHKMSFFIYTSIWDAGMSGAYYFNGRKFCR